MRTNFPAVTATDTRFAAAPDASSFSYGPVVPVAFVGGGFHTAGLHSVLEPAAYGAPVLFGPRFDRSRDAGLMIKAGGALAVTRASEIADAMVRWFQSADARNASGAKARGLVERGRGAAERSLQLVERLLA